MASIRRAVPGPADPGPKSSWAVKNGQRLTLVVGIDKAAKRIRKIYRNMDLSCSFNPILTRMVFHSQVPLLEYLFWGTAMPAFGPLQPFPLFFPVLIASGRHAGLKFFRVTWWANFSDPKRCKIQPPAIQQLSFHTLLHNASLRPGEKKAASRISRRSMAQCLISLCFS